MNKKGLGKKELGKRNCIQKIQKKTEDKTEVKIEKKIANKDGTVSGTKKSTDTEKLKKVKSETKNSVTSSSSGVIDFTDDNDYNFENGENGENDNDNGNLKIMTGSESKSDLEIKTEQETTTATIKPKYKSLTLLEDPMQFHAKPRDLAKNALKRPREMDSTKNNIVTNNHIFSRVSFSALPLDVRLSSLLEKSTAEVCFIFCYFSLILVSF